MTLKLMQWHCETIAEIMKLHGVALQFRDCA